MPLLFSALLMVAGVYEKAITNGPVLAALGRTR